jgi:hypothetical protein
MEGEDYYSVEEAAKVLKLKPGCIRQMLRAELPTEQAKEAADAAHVGSLRETINKF